MQLYYKNLLVYRINYNEYTGGAHGIYMTTFLNMDLINLRPLKLDDIFTGDYKEALTDLLWNQLMADKKVTTHEALEEIKIPYEMMEHMLGSNPIIGEMKAQ